MCDRGSQFADGRDAVGVRELHLRVTKSFGGQHVLREIAGDHERVFYALRVKLQRRISYNVVPAAGGSLEPVCIAGLFSGKASIQIGFGSSSEHFLADDVSHMHPDDPLDRDSPNLLVHRIGASKAVIPVYDAHEVW